jgi:hypothetical protein
VALGTPAALVGDSGLSSRIAFSLDRDADGFAELVGPELPAAKVSGRTAQLPSTRVEDDLHRIFELCRRAGWRVAEIVVHAPTLEDVYLARTGSSWPDDGKGDAT